MNESESKNSINVDRLGPIPDNDLIHEPSPEEEVVIAKKILENLKNSSQETDTSDLEKAIAEAEEELRQKRND